MVASRLPPLPLVSDTGHNDRLEPIILTPICLHFSFAPMNYTKVLNSSLHLRTPSGIPPFLSHLEHVILHFIAVSACPSDAFSLTNEFHDLSSDETLRQLRPVALILLVMRPAFPISPAYSPFTLLSWRSSYEYFSRVSGSREPFVSFSEAVPDLLVLVALPITPCLKHHLPIRPPSPLSLFSRAPLSRSGKIDCPSRSSTCV